MTHLHLPATLLPALAEQRAETLRRIAAEEIEAHRERHGFLGTALDGSLALGAVWPSSDLDLTIVPRPGQLQRSEIEWGQRNGIVWHKHVTYRSVLLELMDGYPRSFIGRAEGPFNHDASWFIDGLAVMEIWDDPEGVLEEAKTFVSARRFAPEVLEGRQAAFMIELRRLLEDAQQREESGDSEGTYWELSCSTGFAAVAAQIWLESAHRVYSSKEQDGLLSQVTQEAGHPEAHDLYRQVMVVDAAKAESLSPQFLQIAEEGSAFYQRIGQSAPEGHYYRDQGAVWAAWIHHSAATLGIAPAMGHPALVYQRMDGSWKGLGYWASRQPLQIAAEFLMAETPDAEELVEKARTLSELYETVSCQLFDPDASAERARSSLQAAEELYRMTVQGVK